MQLHSGVCPLSLCLLSCCTVGWQLRCCRSRWRGCHPQCRGCVGADVEACAAERAGVMLYNLASLLVPMIASLFKRLKAAAPSPAAGSPPEAQAACVDTEGMRKCTCRCPCVCFD